MTQDPIARLLADLTQLFNYYDVETDEDVVIQAEHKLAFRQLIEAAKRELAEKDKTIQDLIDDHPELSQGRRMEE